MSEWQPPGERPAHWRVQNWATGHTRQALGKRIHQQWQRLTAKADPRVLAVQKAVFAAAPQHSPPLLHHPSLYRNRYLTADIQRYRAAASLVPIAEEMCEISAVDPSEIAGPQSYHGILGEDGDAEVVARLADWQGLYSPTGRRYGSLSRTLMQLPGGIPCDLLRFLSWLQLIRPMTDRLELATLLLDLSDSEERGEPADQEPLRLNLFQRATRTEIRQGLQQLSEELQTPLSQRRTAHIWKFVRYVQDFPDDYRGRLPELARQAIRWHRTVGRRRRELGLLRSRIDETTPTKLPPIPLPEIPGVRFLGTVGEVLNGGGIGFGRRPRSASNRRTRSMPIRPAARW